MNPLLGLLLGASQEIDPTVAESGPDISVTARSKKPLVEEEEVVPRSLGNRGNVEEILQAAGNAPQRKGMFGLKGTFRDVLGTLGDALLVQSGNKQVYAPHRQQERESDAMAGFTQDPLAAIERLSGVNATAAQKMYGDFQTTAAKKEAIATAAADKRRDDALKFGTMAAGFIGKAQDQGAWSVAYPILKKRADAMGFDLENDFGITEQYDPAVAETIYSGAINPYQTETIRTKDEAEGGRTNRTVIQESGRTSRNNTNEAGRNARNTVNEAGRNQRNKENNDARAKTSRTRKLPPLPPGLAGFKVKPVN